MKISSLQGLLISNDPEAIEPTAAGEWLTINRDDLPFSALAFHFDTQGKLLAVRITNVDGNRIVATSEDFDD